MEEIVVGSKDMPFEDYLSCRIMNLFVETYVNNGLCDEIFSAIRAMDISVFEFLIFLNERNDLYSLKLNERIESFLAATRDDLYDTYEDRIKELRDWSRGRARPASVDVRMADLFNDS